MVLLYGVNLGTVLLAGIAAYLLGWAWHVGLGSFWMKFTKTSKQEMKKMHQRSGPGAYIGEFVALLVTAFAIGAIVNMTGLSGAWSGAGLGALAWLGFVAATTISLVLWGTQTLRMWISGNAYRLLALMLIGAIMA